MYDLAWAGGDFPTLELQAGDNRPSMTIRTLAWGGNSWVAEGEASDPITFAEGEVLELSLPPLVLFDEFRHACNNELDDDGDGWIDLDDPDCADGGTRETGFDEDLDCNDGIDNDDDNLIDAEDLDCEDASDDEYSECLDGKDNDGDGWKDGDDPDCSFDVYETGFDATWQCNDGEDNDGDGDVDADDSNCESARDRESLLP